MPRTTAAPRVDETEGMWAVLDTRAVNKLREHLPVAGFAYKLSASQKTFMPQEHAVVFLRSKSFVVFNEMGERVASMPEASAERAGVTRPVLAPGEVIANLDELTDNALLARCKMRPGGERLKAKTARKKLIEFLLDSESTSKKTEAEDGDSEIEDMDDDDARKMLENSETGDDIEMGE
jgi:hypothetical protein